MGKFANGVKVLGEIVTEVNARQKEVNDLASKLVSKTYGVDFDQAKKIAHVLVTQAEITWK